MRKREWKVNGEVLKEEIVKKNKETDIKVKDSVRERDRNRGK